MPKHHPASKVEAPSQADFPDLKLPVPDLSEVKSLRSSAKRLSSLILQRQSLKAKIKSLEAQAGEISNQILPILFKADVKAVVVEGRTVRQMESIRRILSKTKLIEAGVSPQTIHDCEDESRSVYLGVYEPRGGEVE